MDNGTQRGLQAVGLASMQVYLNWTYATYPSGSSSSSGGSSGSGHQRYVGFSVQSNTAYFADVLGGVSLPGLVPNISFTGPTIWAVSLFTPTINTASIKWAFNFNRYYPATL